MPRYGLNVIAVLYLASCSDEAGLPTSCDQGASDGPIVVDSRRIGPYGATETFSDLRSRCPLALPTRGSRPETRWAALDLSMGELTILALDTLHYAGFANVTDTAPNLSWDASPSAWIVRGCGALLPRGVSSCAAWSEVVEAYGTAGNGDAQFGPVEVWFRDLPGVFLKLDVTDEDVGPIEVHQDLSRIPATARIVEIYVDPARGGAG